MLYIILITLTILLMILIAFLWKIILNHKRLLIDLVNDNYILNKTILEQDKTNKLLQTILMINYLLLTANQQEYEKFTYFYNKLYFLGVSQEILNNNEQLIEFYYDLLENKYDLKEGKKPFTFEFVLKDNNQ